MNYKYNEDLGIFEVEEEVVVELKDVKTWFETLEDIADELEMEDICLPFDEVIEEDEEFLEDIVIKTNKRCNITNKYVSIIALKEFMGIEYPINPKTNHKGDKMVKIYKEEELDTMTDEQYDSLGCIYEETTEEQKDTTYNNQSEVIMALINTFKVDLRSTEAYEKLINKAKRSTTPINTNQFYDVLYNLLFEWDCPMIDMGKDIRIECVIEDASFDYEYGDICATHTCYIPLGYNIIIEDID